MTPGAYLAWLLAVALLAALYLVAFRPWRRRRPIVDMDVRGQE